MVTSASLVKLAHRVTGAEQEARIKEIAEALENAGAAPAAGWDVTLKDIAWKMYSSSFGSIGRALPRKPTEFNDEDRQRLAEIQRIVTELLDLNSTEVSVIRELLEE
jgi:hypothetical protein